MFEDLDVDLDEWDFDAEFDLYMEGEDGSGGIGRDGEARDALAMNWDDPLQSDPLNMEGAVVAPEGFGDFDPMAFMESDRDTERRLAGAAMDSDDRA